MICHLKNKPIMAGWETSSCAKLNTLIFTNKHIPLANHGNNDVF